MPCALRRSLALPAGSQAGHASGCFRERPLEPSRSAGSGTRMARLARTTFPGTSRCGSDLVPGESVPHDDLPCWQAPRSMRSRTSALLVGALRLTAHATAPGEGPGAVRSGVTLGLSPAGRHPPSRPRPQSLAGPVHRPCPGLGAGKRRAGQVRRSTYRRWQLLWPQGGQSPHEAGATYRARPATERSVGRPPQLGAALDARLASTI
jgi:hypothetical protein